MPSDFVEDTGRRGSVSCANFIVDSDEFVFGFTAFFSADSNVKNAIRVCKLLECFSLHSPLQLNPIQMHMNYDD